MNDAAATDDLHTMLLAWNGGTDTQRAVALALADRNRERAQPRLMATGKAVQDAIARTNTPTEDVQ